MSLTPAPWSQWPFVPSDNRYCPVPALVDMFTPIPNIWTLCYPLVHVIVAFGNQTAADGSSLSEITSANLSTTLFALHRRAKGKLVGDLSSETRFPSTPLEFPTVTLIDAKFCSFGWSFVLEAVTGYLLAVISFACFLALSYFSSRHAHRKLLFFLLTAIGVVRGLFGNLAANRIAEVHMFWDTTSMMDWFFNNTVPMNMLGDLLTAYADFLLTFFWLQFVAPRWSKSYWGTFVPIAFAVITAVVGAVTFAVDFNQVHSHQDYNGGNVYVRSLAYIAGLLLSSSLLHSVVVLMLLRLLFTHHSALAESSLPAQSLTPKLRRNMIAVSVIAFFSVICGVLRGIVIVGRVAEVRAFVEGEFSLNNPTFTTIYFVVLMNIPCVVISVAFFYLSWDLLWGSSSSDPDGEQSDDDEGDASASLFGDQTQSSFVIRYLRRLDRDTAASTATSATHFSSQVLVSGESTVLSGRRSGGPDIVMSTTPTKPSPAPTSQPTSQSRRGLGASASHSAMFAGSVPSARSGGFGKSTRTLQEEDS